MNLPRHLLLYSTIKAIAAFMLLVPCVQAQLGYTYQKCVEKFEPMTSDAKEFCNSHPDQNFQNRGVWTKQDYTIYVYWIGEKNSPSNQVKIFHKNMSPDEVLDILTSNSQGSKWNTSTPTTTQTKNNEGIATITREDGKAIAVIPYKSVPDLSSDSLTLMSLIKNTEPTQTTDNSQNNNNKGVGSSLLQPVIDSLEEKRKEAVVIAKINAIITAINTAKIRYAISPNAPDSIGGKEVKFSTIQNYLINTKTNELFLLEELANKENNGTGKNITSLGTYPDGTGKSIPATFGDDRAVTE